MKRLFISQPMKGLTDDEILATREKAIKSAEEKLGEPVEVIDSFFQNAPADAKPLWYLAKSIELLATADVAYFAPGWENARGCRIENTCAVEYGIDVIEDYADSGECLVSFGAAIEALKTGLKMARKGWNGKKQYVQLATNISYVDAEGNTVNVEHEAIGNKAIAFVGTSGVQMGWLASQADMLAEDWRVVK
ncbi:Thoeris anti-defense Tad2 family protein [Enterocloster asparagiformis]|uniref:Thoeris anti-defense Tad2 family protein n=1 Tax=Enterocloster asparagiformis TaxID=333367 RepID=UPI0004B4301A|nr:MW1434 family type I TA system toxin [Enterocloster asparagiformis]